MPRADRYLLPGYAWHSATLTHVCTSRNINFPCLSLIAAIQKRFPAYIINTVLHADAAYLGINCIFNSMTFGISRRAEYFYLSYALTKCLLGYKAPFVSSETHSLCIRELNTDLALGRWIGKCVIRQE